MPNSLEIMSAHGGGILLAAFAAVLLAACGGSSSDGTSSLQATPREEALGATQPAAPASIPSEVENRVAEPFFHVAPVLLDPPDDRDEVDNAASARHRPHTQNVPAEQESLGTRGLTVQVLRSAHRMQALSTQSSQPADGNALPMTSSSAVSTYSPAQIRAAYGLPSLPMTGVTPTAAQAAQLGAGQTIYIINARHDPNVAAELSAFNQKFGLPPCTSRKIAANASLPLTAAATADECVLSVAYSTANATITNTAPAYNSSWATEIALDVQWAHATAPLARIVLIEAPDASLSGLLGAIKVANAMGPGIVSMSFGLSEGSWISSVDSVFSGSGMTYLAATGDSGVGVSWPSVSASVVAVGGTSLTYSDASARTEIAWSSTGGGISQYLSTPNYQVNTVPGVGSLAHRAVADVAFNADPRTGQFVAVIQPGSSAVNWISAGGTSLSTPQWAGIVAVTNAMRVQSGKAVLGTPHSLLYEQIGAVPGTYARAFSDITSGSDGACPYCHARTGYDQVTGLGTPNVTDLLNALVSSGMAAPAPAVTSSAIIGKAGVALSFKIAVAASNPVSYTLSGAPSGMSISSSGLITWANPVAGTYSVLVTVKDTQTSRTGQGVYTVTIAGAQAPVIKSSTLSGSAGKLLTGTISISDPGGYVMSVSITGPSGMAYSFSGQTLTVRWAKPVKGNYTLIVSVKNSAGLSSQAKLPITIAAK